MVKRSHGKMSGRTRVLGASSKKLTPTIQVRKYKVGDVVFIDPQSRYTGMPHPRYRGKTGTISKLRGTAYEVQIKDQNAHKTLIICPVHLHLKK